MVDIRRSKVRSNRAQQLTASDPIAGDAVRNAHEPTPAGQGLSLTEDLRGRVALSVAEFSAAFGRHRSWGYRALYAGRVRCLDLPGVTLIPLSEVNRLMSQLVNHGEEN